VKTYGKTVLLQNREVSADLIINALDKADEQIKDGVFMEKPLSKNQKY